MTEARLLKTMEEDGRDEEGENKRGGILSG